MASSSYGSGGGPSARYSALLRQIDLSVQAGDYTAAAVFAEEALGVGPEHPGLLNLVAYRDLQTGALDSALTRLERARQLAPRDVNVLNSLGNLFRRMGRLREALGALDAAVAAAPGHLTAQFNRAAVLEDLMELSAAQTGYETVLRLDPRHIDALGRLSLMAANRGDYDAALAFAKRAGEDKPGKVASQLSDYVRQCGDTAGALRLAQIAIKERPEGGAPLLALGQAQLAAGEVEPALQNAKLALADTTMTAQMRAIAQGLLGDAEDRQGNAAAAFDAFRAANEELRRTYEAQYQAPGSRYGDWAEGFVRYFEAADAAQWRADPSAPAEASPVAQHIFLVGFPRSGTTLLEQALGAHPRIAAMSEISAINDAAVAYTQSAADLPVLALRRPGDLIAERAIYWRMSRAAVPDLDGKVFIDKMPLNTTILCAVAKMFPRAKVLFASRDPRDVVLSCFRSRFEMNAAMFEFLTLETTARLYDLTMRLGDLYREKLGLEFIDVRYADVVRDFEGTVRGLCQAFGIEFHEAMLDVAARARTGYVKTPSRQQLARGLYDGSGQWRKFRDQLAPVLPVLAPWVARFGYSED